MNWEEDQRNYTRNQYSLPRANSNFYSLNTQIPTLPPHRYIRDQRGYLPVNSDQPPANPVDSFGFTNRRCAVPSLTQGLETSPFNSEQWGNWSSHGALISEIIEIQGWQEKYTLLLEAFRHFGVEHEGYLNREEFGRLLNRYPCVEEAYLDIFYDLFDRNLDGFLKQTEFVSGMMAVSPTASHQLPSPLGNLRLQFIFRYYDANKDGLLSSSELSHLLSHVHTLRTERSRRDPNRPDRKSVLDLMDSVAELLGAPRRKSIDDSNDCDWHQESDAMVAKAGGVFGYRAFYEAVMNKEIKGTQLLLRTKKDLAEVVEHTLQQASSPVTNRTEVAVGAENRPSSAAAPDPGCVLTAVHRPSSPNRSSSIFVESSSKSADTGEQENWQRGFPETSTSQFLDTSEDIMPRDAAVDLATQEPHYTTPGVQASPSSAKDSKESFPLIEFPLSRSPQEKVLPPLAEMQTLRHADAPNLPSAFALDEALMLVSRPLPAHSSKDDTWPQPLSRDGVDLQAPKNPIYPAVPAASLASALGVLDFAKKLEPRTLRISSGGRVLPQLISQPADVLSLCNAVVPLLNAEDSLVHASGGAVFIGGLHGNLASLLQIFERLGWPSCESNSTTNFVFLGNIVDRGRYSIELVIFIFALKVAFPSRVHLLRGAHEDFVLNWSLGFNEEVVRKYDGQLVWDRVNDVFEFLPLAAVIDGYVLAVHGGIGKHFRSVRDVQGLVKPSRLPQTITRLPCKADDGKAEAVVFETIWGRPDEAEKLEEATDFEELMPSTFSLDDLEAFEDNDDVQLIVRGHDYLPRGFEWLHGGKTLSLFSSRGYCEGLFQNDAAFAILPPRAKDTVRPRIHVKTIKFNEPLRPTALLDLKSQAAIRLRDLIHPSLLPCERDEYEVLPWSSSSSDAAMQLGGSATSESLGGETRPLSTGSLNSQAFVDLLDSLPK